MNQSVAVSARSFVIAGMSAAVVASAAVSPVSTPDLTAARLISAATQLTSITTPIEVAIKNTYNAIEPWAAYGAELGQWALSFIPGLWWLAPGIDLAYYTAEPLVQAGVYTFADVVGLNFAQIGPDITNGINASVNNAITYGLAWLNSLVPFPPFPPLPPLPGASVAAAAAVLPAASATVVAGAQAKSITTPIEVAIKNSYNAVEPWVRYGMQWVDYVAGLIPIVNWFSPVIPLAYYTIEPLVRAGTYATADLIGLNFAAIWPEIWTGITTSSNNFITGVLNWGYITLPPPLPGAAVAAPGAAPAAPAAASVRAAAAVPAPDTAAPDVPSTTGAVTGTVPKAEGNTAGKDTPAPESPALAIEAAPVTPATGGATAPAETPSIDLPAVSEPAADNAAPPVRTAHRGPSASATSGDADSASTTAKAGRHARGSD